MASRDKTPLVAVGRIAAGMESETRGFPSVCVENEQTWVSALPHPDAVDAVTQLCPLPAPAAGLGQGIKGSRSRLLPGLLPCSYRLCTRAEQG